MGRFTWIVCFVLLDLGYYWFHRFGHELNFMWAAHVTHHSSEEYNLTTALRQGKMTLLVIDQIIGALQYTMAWAFYTPIALLIPPRMFSFHGHLNRIYQFFIHTRIVDKLPAIIEYIFNTPRYSSSF